ncbi:MAG: hypothetical protein H8E15_04485 [Planctomycetes bacterium]|nr:hypothetical protein [Planctomycetota bacterium]
MKNWKTWSCLFAAWISLAGGPLPATDCTGIYYAEGGVVLAGNNEDYWRPDTRMWFVPSEGKTHGRVYFGFSDMYPQGGMNEAGLFFDGFATFKLPLKDQTGRLLYRGNLIDKAMADCGSVAEVVSLLENYDLSFLASAMLMFGDKYGDSVIIEGDDILRKKGRHQVVTNFYQSRMAEENYNCARYASANAIIGNSPKVNVDVMKRALASTHIERVSPTQYSNIYDLKNGVIYLYHFHNFQNEVVINLAEELAKGKRIVEISSLFPTTFAWTQYLKEAEGKLQKEIDMRRDASVKSWSYPPLAGSYEVQAKSTRWEMVKVFLMDSKLMVQVDDQPAEELIPEGKDRYFHVDFNGSYTFEFQRNKNGSVTGLEFVGSGVRIHAERSLLHE